uniref:Catsper channel auxiliary subunit zeta n=1 Tax=Canis lupus familiaris TaxID=9615 RepID=A0A8C0NDW3_CANLF
MTRRPSQSPGGAQGPRPQPARLLLPESPRPVAALVVCGPQASLGSHGSDDSSPDNDIRNLWTRATLSQPELNVPRSKICDDSDAEGSSLGSKTRQWYSRKAGRESDGGWEEWEDGEDKDGFRREGLHEHLSLEMELLEGAGGAFQLRAGLGFLGHLSLLLPLQLPLPLMEVMENEALEILTKALWSYRSGIGRDHFLTKQLQRYIEGLKRRRSKRLHLVTY